MSYEAKIEKLEAKLDVLESQLQAALQMLKFLLKVDPELDARIEKMMTALNPGSKKITVK